VRDSAPIRRDFKSCEETGKVFAIGTDQDQREGAIAAIPEADWKMFRDGQIAETVHCMSNDNKAFRLIVMRLPRDQDLFEEKSPGAITPSPATARRNTQPRR